MDPPDPDPGCVSVRSDWSKDCGNDFKRLSENPCPSGESGRSDQSKDCGNDFKRVRLTPEDPSGHPQTLDAIIKRLDENILTFVKDELERIHRVLASDYLENEEDKEQSSRQAFRKIAMDFLKRMDQEQLAEHLQNRSYSVFRGKLKSRLQKRFSCVFEGIAKEGNPSLLNQIYTELYITEGGAAVVNQEHEVRHIETIINKPAVSEIITCEDIFKGPTHRHEPIRTVLTEEQRPIIKELTEARGPIITELTEARGPIITELTEAPGPSRTVLTEGQGPMRTLLTEEQRPIIKELTEARGPIITELTEEQGPIRTELTEARGPIRTVLTKGVAGIGKTVLTQKFCLDWAEGRANQDIQLLFPFTFRELNVLRDRQFSLVGLLQHFFSESAGLFQDLQVVFIFDGMDECRCPLDFTQTRALTETTESASMDVLLVNLIRGTLLPSARLWITTRPAAANQIPAEFISMVTEVRGFTNPQKEQYFRKRFRDQQQATAIVSHIKTSRSLHIMCQIPVFCWLTTTVLENVIKEEKPKFPKTLTQMYIHFLVVQAKVKSKYDGRSETDLPWTPSNRTMVESLGKLAFEQLQKGNLIFYESDLKDCGLEPTEASVYSGVFTQVFREEPGLYQDMVYCFIHLSVQEFLAALHVHLTFFNSGVNLLSKQQTNESNASEAAFYVSAVEKALQSPNGHLDLFLRFLLGLSLPTNQRLLQGLLTQPESSSLTNQETAEYIKETINKGLSVERSMNLFHCLNELNNQCLVEEIQRYMRQGRLSDRHVSPAQWSALAFILLSSDTDLERFDLRKYSCSEHALLGLLSVIKASSKAILSCCHVSQSSCGPLSSVLSSSSLTHLDLSNNPIQDSGVELLCYGLKSTPCRLETLRLSGCLITEKGGGSLASALSSIKCHLRELDLSYNHPGPSAELVTALQEDPHSLLETLRLEPSGEQWMISGLRKYFRELTLDPNTAHRFLQLSENNQRVTWANEGQQYPDHLDRFSHRPQVLSSTGLTGSCYWEVDWSGQMVELAVTYRGITRKGDSFTCSFGDNDQSWSLRITNRYYAVHHNHKQTEVHHPLLPSFSEGVGYSGAVGVPSGRVAVFLDSEGGSLSFYEVLSDGKLFHIYTFSSTFNEPLFAGVSLWPDSQVHLV